MAAAQSTGKLYTLFTLIAENVRSAGQFFTGVAGEVRMVGAIAIAMFVALVGWGGKYFGWEDPDGHVQLALITAFVLGVIGGIKARS